MGEREYMQVDTESVELMCPQHNIDYRIACEECQKRWELFQKVVASQLLRYEENKNPKEKV